MDEYLDPDYRYLEDMDEVELKQLSRKKKRLSLSKTKCKDEDKENKTPSVSRFKGAFSLASDTNYDEMAKGYVPKNTSKSTNWAVNNFNEWRDERNKVFSDEQCPTDLLDSPMDKNALLSYWLSRFLVETRQKNGNKYPAKTLYQLLCGINRYIRSIDARAPNLIDNKEPEFKELLHTTDSYFRTLKIDGVGAAVKHAAIISKDEENLLWEKAL